MQTKKTIEEDKFEFSSDEDDPELLESNKEIEKLNAMWKNLKEVLYSNF